jgi:hypothetical protein
MLYRYANTSLENILSELIPLHNSSDGTITDSGGWRGAEKGIAAALEKVGIAL